MKKVAVSVTVLTAVAVVGGAAVFVPRLLSTESTSTVTAAKTVARAEVEKQVRDNYALPLVEDAPRSVSCLGDLDAAKPARALTCTVTFEDAKKQDIAVSVTGVDGDEVSYDYSLLQD
jgi:hypothetical protein